MTINLMPWRERQQKKCMFVLYASILLSDIVIVIAIAWLHAWLLQQIKQIHFMLRVHPQTHYHSMVTHLKQIMQHQRLMLATLTHIGALTPSHCRLIRLAQRDQAIEIQGIAANAQSIQQFMQQLRTLTGLYALVLKKVDQYDEVQFIIAAKFIE